MLVFAIDTALEACSAAVFDSERDEIIARESIPMARGHAEALMPLIARVREQSGSTLRRSTASPSPPDPAASPACASASPPRAASASPPANRLSACRRSRPMPRPLSPTDPTLPVVVGDRCASRSCLSANLRHRRPHAWCRRAWCRSPKRCACRPAARRAWSAPPPTCWPRPGAQATKCRSSVEQQHRARYRLGGAARRHRRRHRVAGQAALSARARRPAATRGATGAAMIGLFRQLFGGGEPSLSDATTRDADAIAALHAASFRRGWSEEEVESYAGRPRRDRASRQ